MDGPKTRIRPVVYDTLLEQQGGVCWICGKVQEGHRLSLDHSHSSGQFRGLLCKPCNSALGWWEKYAECILPYLNPTRINKVDNFIRSFPEQLSGNAARNLQKTYCKHGHQDWKIDRRGHRYCYTCARQAGRRKTNAR